MNTAIVKNVACAKNGSPTLFVESKSGNVYKFNTSVPADRAPTIIAKIKAAGVINIKLWTKVREGRYVKPEPRISYDEDIVHANKMWAFESTGDIAGMLVYLEARIAQQEAS